MSNTELAIVQDKSLAQRPYNEINVIRTPYTAPRSERGSSIGAGLLTLPIGIISLAAFMNYWPAGVVFLVLNTIPIAIAADIYKDETMESQLTHEVYKALTDGQRKQFRKAARKKSRRRNSGQVLEFDLAHSCQKYRIEFLADDIKITLLHETKIPKKNRLESSKRKAKMILSSFTSKS